MTGKSPIRKRSIVVCGHRTSISMENEFWNVLKTIASTKGQSLSTIISHLDAHRKGNLSSTIRIFVLKELLNQNSKD
ncbi:MAG: aryl-sulfate sulfotransferase [Rhodospirillaceae bacterium]|nr:aryl-sulfate sulfotransferase [Rhodospirillaceae bacterium]